jgi:AraC family transcriptional regulator
MNPNSTLTPVLPQGRANFHLKETCSGIRSRTVQQWDNILVEEIQILPGQEQYESATSHTICMSLNHAPSNLLQVVGNRQHTSPCTRGDICIVPAGHPFLWQWQREDHYVRIQLSLERFEQLAQEVTDINHVSLTPQFRVRHAQIEQISLLLLHELKNSSSFGALYVDSLTTALMVQLLRNFSGSESRIIPCDEGLSDRQMLQVTDYVNENLAQEIKISELAKLTRMSHFHFSRLFKQAMGITPHQYVIEQRVEKAKQLLKQSQLSVLEIAMLCGFSSHSHLGKCFRQHTGMSPKQYRES